MTYSPVSFKMETDKDKKVKLNFDLISLGLKTLESLLLKKLIAVQESILGPGLLHRYIGKLGSDVTATGDLTLPPDGNYFNVSGTTTINGIGTTNWQPGSMITLQFNSIVTVKFDTAASATFASLYLAGAVDFAASVDDTLTLRYDGTRWREICRTLI